MCCDLAPVCSCCRTRCRILDCGRWVVNVTHQLCAAHYQRHLKYGTADAGRPVRRYATRFCGFAGCAGAHYALGWCMSHWNRFEVKTRQPSTGYKPPAAPRGTVDPFVAATVAAFRKTGT